MGKLSRSQTILHELRHHIPFTFTGALCGIFFMYLFRDLSYRWAHSLFMVFHPLHVVLSAMVTAALFRRHRRDASVWKVFVIGYIGSIGIATLSDCIIPYIGERMFGLSIPTHAALHHSPAGHDASESAETAHDHHDAAADPDAEAYDHHEGHDAHAHQTPDGGGLEGIHLGFIEEWYLVNPAALLGMLIAYFIPRTEFPHALHILVSTWASAAHILMSAGGEMTLAVLGGMIPVLFLAVWLPCCTSDIIFPSLFFKLEGPQDACGCGHHHA